MATTTAFGTSMLSGLSFCKYIVRLFQSITFRGFKLGWLISQLFTMICIIHYRFGDSIDEFPVGLLFYLFNCKTFFDQ
jgi:hypothetical protein